MDMSLYFVLAVSLAVGLAYVSFIFYRVSQIALRSVWATILAGVIIVWYGCAYPSYAFYAFGFYAAYVSISSLRQIRKLKSDEKLINPQTQAKRLDLCIAKQKMLRYWFFYIFLGCAFFTWWALLLFVH